jgi:hypothetical protein
VKKQFEMASLNGQILPLLTSLRFASLHFGFPVGMRKMMVPPRSLQLLVGTFFLIRRAIRETDLLLSLTSHFLFASRLKKC